MFIAFLDLPELVSLEKLMDLLVDGLILNFLADVLHVGLYLPALDLLDVPPLHILVPLE